MFKRVSRRQKRQERDEEMGLDAETKEVLGLHDTDSDESSSSSDSEDGSDSRDGSALADVEINNEGDDDEDEDEDEPEDAQEGLLDQDEEDPDSEDASEASDDEEPPLSVQEALKDPLYIISLDPETRACIACPGKLLKNPTMCEVHRSSNAHVRRYKRFTELARQVGSDTSVRDILSQLSAGPGKTTDDEVSKRAEKRQAKLAKIKAKRAKQKGMKAKGIVWKKEKTAKASAPTSEAESEAKPATPPTKKRKLQADGDHSPRAVLKSRLLKSRLAKEATTPVHTPAKPTEPSQTTKTKRPEVKQKPQKSKVVPPATDLDDAPSRPTTKALRSTKSGKASPLKASRTPRRAPHGSEHLKGLSNGAKRKRTQKDAA